MASKKLLRLYFLFADAQIENGITDLGDLLGNIKLLRSTVNDIVLDFDTIKVDTLDDITVYSIRIPELSDNRLWISQDAHGYLTWVRLTCKNHTFT